MNRPVFTPQVDVDLTPPDGLDDPRDDLNPAKGFMAAAIFAAVFWPLVIGLGFGLAAFLGFMARLFLAYFGGL